MKKFTLAILVLTTCVFAIFAQATIWKNHNPFGDGLFIGQLIEIEVNEVFKFDINSRWQDSTKINMRLRPDRSNIEMIKDVDQSKTNERETNVLLHGNDIFKLNVSGEIKEKLSEQGKYSIVAKKSLVVDRKPYLINLKGEFMASSMSEGKLLSKDISNLELNVVSKPEVVKDKNLKLKTVDPNDTGKPKRVLTEQAQRELLLKHIQEVMGYFK